MTLYQANLGQAARHARHADAAAAGGVVLFQTALFLDTKVGGAKRVTFEPDCRSSNQDDQ